MTPDAKPIDALTSDLRDHAGALRRHADAWERSNVIMDRGITVADKGIEAAKEMPGVIGRETRDTATHVVLVGSLGTGGLGGFLMILWFIIKIILIFIAGKK